jgi:UDP-N-acetylglucosamine 2-epimerase
MKLYKINKKNLTFKRLNMKNMTEFGNLMADAITKANNNINNLV